jgi:pimeloyl-ACP methyl ester carboxylesterase
MKINRHNLNVQMHGPEEGLMVMFIHHGLGSLRAWRQQVPAFVQAGYRVVVYDRWGYGDSELRFGLGVPCFDQDVRDILTLLRRFKRNRVFLVGHSDGGTIALLFAATYPEKVIALVAIGAHVYVEPKLFQGIQGVYDSYQQNERFRRALAQIHGDKVDVVFKNWYDGWQELKGQSWDIRPVLNSINCPVLIIQGESDEHATVQHARDLAKEIPGSQLWLVPGEGHMFPQRQPDLFNQGVLEFMHKSKEIH